MSADNSICILKSTGVGRKPEYRVAHVQNVEMTEYHDVAARDEYLQYYFGACKVYRTRERAFRYAAHLLRGEMFVEYGIVEVDLRGRFPGKTGDSENLERNCAAGVLHRRSSRKSRPSCLQRQVKALTERVEQLERLLASRT
jgi:hypothetical protein